MIYIKVRNCLGNQMFVYAFGDFLAERFPRQKIKYDFSELPLFMVGRRLYDVDDIFTSKFPRVTDKEIRRYCGKPFFFKRITSADTIWNRAIRKINSISRFSPQIKVISEPVPWDIPESFLTKVMRLELQDDRDYYFDGYWEDDCYIKHRRSALKKIFVFRDRRIPDDLEKVLESRETVFVHVRRGDYIKESEQERLPKNYYALCGELYYREAFKLIEKQVVAPYYVFFSDDTRYVLETFKDLKDKMIITGNRDYKDMYLMSLCKHSIIANSTFSFWGAFLKEQEGIVVAPKLHYIRVSDERSIDKPFFNIPGWTYIENDGR